MQQTFWKSEIGGAVLGFSSSEAQGGVTFPTLIWEDALHGSFLKCELLEEGLETPLLEAPSCMNESY